MQYFINKDKLQSFTYKGISSADFNIIITNTNQLSSPERNVEIIEVDGKNEALIIDKGNYKPFKLEFECVIDSEDTNINELSRNIKHWLQNDYTYNDLVLSDDYDYSYEAVCINKLDIIEVVEEVGEFQITFLCKPLRKHKSGEKKITLTSNATIYNNYMTSKPIIKVLGSGDITLNINDQKVILKGIDGEIVLDCEVMNAYKEIDNEIILQNNKMYSEFPILEEGNNKISFTGNVNGIEIIPKWVMI